MRSNKQIKKLKTLFGGNKIALAGVGVCLVIGAIFVVAKAYDSHNRQAKIEKSIDHLALAREFSSNLKNAEAESEYLKVLSADKNNKTAWRELGLVYQQSKKTSEAIDAYEKSLGDSGQDASTYNLLGNLYRDATLYDKAENAYKQAITLNPSMSVTVINLSHVYTLEQKDSEALALLASHFDGTRNTTTIGLQLASTYLADNKQTEAKKILEQILAVDPENKKASDILASI